MLKLCLKKKKKSKKEAKERANYAQAETLQKGSWRLVLDLQEWGGNEESLLLVVEAEDSFC